MEQSIYPSCLIEWKKKLQVVQQAIAALEPDPAAIKSSIEVLGELMQEQVIPLPLEVIPVTYQSRWGGIRTELERTLRLLRTELVFWQMARTPERREHYQQRLLGHLQQLMGFAAGIIDWYKAADHNGARA